MLMETMWQAATAIGGTAETSTGSWLRPSLTPPELRRLPQTDMGIRNRHNSKFSRRVVALALAALLAVPSLGAASTDLIHLTCFPVMSVADGKSVVNIDAEVRDTNGKVVPDGTRILFSTDLGSFRTPILTTQNGVAHATLVAGSIAGLAKITATALGLQGSSTLEYQFVSDRSFMSSAKEYIEAMGGKEERYNYEEKLLSASGPKQHAHLL